MTQVVESTIGELLTAVETDHGQPQVSRKMAGLVPKPGIRNSDRREDLDSEDQVYGVCAYGNAALDYLKRLGKPRTWRNIDSLGNILWGSIEVALANIDSARANNLNGATIAHINDRGASSFDSVAEQLRVALGNADISLDTPIQFNAENLRNY